MDSDFNRQMHLIDERYHMENALLDAIAAGDYKRATQTLLHYSSLMDSPLQEYRPSSDDMLREFKKRTHVMNTLFRKTIEASHVHPIYIHEYSTRFDRRIEDAQTPEEISSLIREMLRRYCYLVRNYSLATYSKTIREAILYIELNLYGPLSTGEIAKALNITPNYLSNQFRKETGSTISDYIRRHRIDAALRLLNTTDLSIQEIGGRIGIGDSSYFSHQFKSIVGMSPMEYRKMVHGHVNDKP